MSRSPFRYVPSMQRSQYSVWRGDERVGYVAKISHRHTDRGVTRTIVAGWRPSTAAGIDLPVASTRQAATQALWAAHQREVR